MNFRRSVALFLCVQPVLLKSQVALAQSLEQAAGNTPPMPLPWSIPAPGLAGLDRRAPELGAPVQPPVDRPIDPSVYPCGSGDVLELNFWGVQSFKLRVTIDLEGRAFIPRLGNLRLQGMTLAEARAVLAREATRYYPGLRFDVALVEPRTFVVHVAGAVAVPASYPARAIDRVATLVDRAGGFGARASRRRVEIHRLDGSVVRADLVRFALEGDVAHNPYLRDGDVVRVPFEELAATVFGAVNRPGRYELVAGRDLAELVAVAGGLSPTATTALPIVHIGRAAGDRRTQVLLPFAPGGAMPELTIAAEDVVTIPGYEDLQRSVMVVGAFATALAAPAASAGPGTAPVGGGTAPEEGTATRRLAFADGETVRTLLERVGGPSALADLSRAYVLRRGEAVAVDLNALVMLGDRTADRTIELGDTLVLPFKRRNVLVEGAVFRPGAYPFNPTFGIDQYLSLAGGMNRFARSRADVRVVTADGKTLAYAPGLAVESGASVVVPERDFSRSEVVQIVLAAAGIVLSGTALYLSARK